MPRHGRSRCKRILAASTVVGCALATAGIGSIDKPPIATASPTEPTGRPLNDPLDEATAIEMAEYYHLPIEEARQRVLQQHTSIAFLESLPTTMQREWAGASVDHGNGGRRRWLVTSDSTRRQLESALATSSEAHDLPVSIDVVDHTLTALEAGVDELGTRLVDSGVVTTDVAVDIERNRLTVGMPANDAAYSQQRMQAGGALHTEATALPAVDFRRNRARAQSLIGDFTTSTGIPVTVRAEQTAQVVTPVDCTARERMRGQYRTAHCDDPIRGGVAVFRSTSPTSFESETACTAGLPVRSTIDNRLFLLTAGHCARAGLRDGSGDSGRRWFTHMPKTRYRDHWVGEWWRSVMNYTDGDGGIMAIANPAGWRAGQPIVFVGGSTGDGRNLPRDPAYDIHHRGSWENLSVNDWLCKTGGVDWTDCGRYKGSHVITYFDTPQYTRRFDSMGACGGDSGAPIIMHHGAYGLVAAGSQQAGTRTWASGGGVSMTSNCSVNTEVMALNRPMEALNIRLVTRARP